MVNDAEKFKDEDNKLKNRISAKNGLEKRWLTRAPTTTKRKLPRTATRPSSGWMLNSLQR